MDQPGRTLVNSISIDAPFLQMIGGINTSIVLKPSARSQLCPIDRLQERLMEETVADSLLCCSVRVSDAFQRFWEKSTDGAKQPPSRGRQTRKRLRSSEALLRTESSDPRSSSSKAAALCALLAAVCAQQKEPRWRLEELKAAASFHHPLIRAIGWLCWNSQKDLRGEAAGMESRSPWS